MRQLNAMIDTIALLREHEMDNCEIEEDGCDFAHFEAMLEDVLAAEPPFSEAKLGRWLGWIQGAATACGFLTLEEAKQINQNNKDD